jgi:hypothetical protein
MKDITVEEHELEINGNPYGILHDPITDDWQVLRKNERVNHLGWFLEKTDAIEYVLEKSRIIEDGYYQRAPERC